MAMPYGVTCASVGWPSVVGSDAAAVLVPVA
jgi:hypothetical protein